MQHYVGSKLEQLPNSMALQGNFCNSHKATAYQELGQELRLVPSPTSALRVHSWLQEQ